MDVKVVESEEELQEAYAIRKKVFVEEQKVPLEEEIDQHEAEAVHFLLYNNESPAGAGRFRIVDGIGKAERICVLHSGRKSGAGRLLMEALETYAANEGLKKMKLNAQIQAIPFYERLGYTAISDEFLDAGIPHRTMIKDLPQ
ncbi:GNAT family N-acetyltransferase [Peribacillus sp. SCS-26]|uniref:GNAT family N-acetyltransferase n=1 Tax=Paraperibacillus marinus TaxID=3115295 RepID=UPI003905A2B7